VFFMDFTANYLVRAPRSVSIKVLMENTYSALEHETSTVDLCWKYSYARETLGLYSYLGHVVCTVQAASPWA